MARDRKLTIEMGCGLLVIVFVFVGAFSYYSMVQNDADRRWVSHTHLALEKIEDCSNTLETWAATPDGSRDDLEGLSLEFGELQFLTRDNPTQQTALSFIQAKLEDSLKAKNGAGSPTVPSKVPIPAAREAFINSIRTTLDDMRAEEKRLLKTRTATVEASSSRTKFVIALANLMALGLIIVTYSSIRRQMSARMRAEIALKKSDETFRGLLESAPDAIVVVNREGKIVLVNSQIENVFGYDRQDLIGHPIEMLMPECLRETHKGYASEFFSSPHARSMGRGLDLYGLRKNGTEFPVEISLSPLETTGGLWVSAAIRDVSTRKEIEKKINQLNRQLEQRADELTTANQELEAFTYTAAHDLRAPLRHLHGYSTFLKELWYERLDDEGRHHLDRIMAAARSMATLLDDLLNFSRLGRVEVQKQKVSLSKIVERVRQEMQSDAGIKLVQWRIGELPEVEADPALLYQVVFNLLSNAAKYSRKSEHPRIEVGTSRDEENQSITFFVRDNGTGFDMQYANKLFQVFQRLHRSKDFEGTGIGLAIVRRVIERHGGHVWAEGAIGQGASFYFSLPFGGTEHGQTRIHSAGR